MTKIAVIAAVIALLLPVNAYGMRSPTLKQELHITKAREKSVERISKKTTLRPNEIIYYLDEGISEDGLISCYVIWNIRAEKLDDIVHIYINEGDLDLTLKDFDIERPEYEEAYERLIPSDEAIRGDIVPWKQAPPR